MSRSKLKGKDLRKINYKTDKVRSLAIDIASKNFKHLSKAEKLETFKNVLLHPEDYLNDNILSPIVEEFAPVVKKTEGTIYRLSEEVKPFSVYGKKFISQNTIQQMDMAMSLPIAQKGALMPDAHMGYGLPIGGVLATENEVIPYGIGLDIGCRMSLSIYDTPSNFIKRNHYAIKTALKEQTHFGIGKVQASPEQHEVLDRPEFQETELLRQLHGKACRQIGTSGSGNHFVEVGEVSLENGNVFGFEQGNYLGVLAHSGSRGFGASVANYYMQVAMDRCWLPKKVQHLAWLDLNTEAGIEYWMSMQLAGDYAKACHDVIHRKIAKALDLKGGVKVENHHNFAWKEVQENGKELIVHRKGATPAKKGQLGIIPATMIDPGYIVSGRGNSNSIMSAAHGAGRKMSRKKAKASITGSEVKKTLKSLGVTLIGGGVDEAPMMYKDIEQVMLNQNELVNIEGKFFPKVVRMDKN
ncbi:MAG: RNA-splicing ligase RtcB [Crocinitomicaceae bacterium]|nr:RNA-splicing ligase RtcB [Crocinitomicaceae bacterium]|tara:strand:- start:34794 stop:36200 length:1407 start_codon:yes stop_codon:yes gene_type:complete